MTDFITQMYFDDASNPDNRKLNLALQRRDLIIHGVRPRKRDRLIRPVHRGGPSSEQVASLAPSVARGGDGEPPWARFQADRWVDFPIVLDPDLYAE